MRIAFLLARRVPDVPSPIMLGIWRRLQGAGHAVEGWVPEDRLLRTDTVHAEADLYVLKSHTEVALAYAAALRLQGARILNDLRSCTLAQDKVTASRVLRAAGIPTPGTWLVSDPVQAAPLLGGGRLIVKPHRGHRGADVHLIGSADELAAIRMPAGPVIVQRFVPGPGEDLKVYVAGDLVYAVRKPFDPMSFTRTGRPVAVSPGVRAIAMAARAAFGLELFGIDVIESPDGPMVVDVNYFPGYKGCESPEPAIADVIGRQARDYRWSA